MIFTYEHNTATYGCANSGYIPDKCSSDIAHLKCYHLSQTQDSQKMDTLKVVSNAMNKTIYVGNPHFLQK
jgi:hypothetical protein